MKLFPWMQRGLAGVAVFAFAAATANATFCKLYSYKDYCKQPKCETVFIAEGEFENNGPGGYHEVEYDSAKGTPTQPDGSKAYAHYTWGNDEKVSFSLTYDAVSNMLAYTVGNLAPIYLQPAKCFTEIWIKTHAEKYGAKVKLGNLHWNGEELDRSYIYSRDYDNSYMKISDADMHNGFELTGYIKMSWHEWWQPHGKDLKFSIYGKNCGKCDKPGRVVPAPASAFAGLLGAAGLVAVRRRLV